MPDHGTEHISGPCVSVVMGAAAILATPQNQKWFLRAVQGANPDRSIYFRAPPFLICAKRIAAASWETPNSWAMKPASTAQGSGTIWRGTITAPANAFACHSGSQ